MPVNLSSETKRVEKTKFSLSLNRNNATKLSNENKSASLKNCTRSDTNDNKENKPVKRTSKGTYHNTLHAAKKLKPLIDVARSPESSSEYRLVVEAPLANSAMLNGHHASDNQYGGSTQWKAPIATLSNLGNTCFLNSVLYTLRYAPQFVHNLHHLVSDLSRVEQKLGSIRLKSSSLGRSAAGLASSGTRSWSSKDLLALGQTDNSAAKSKIQIATEKLHETYLSLRAAESKCLHGASDATPEPYAADAFLAALREVNATFEGNRQQDAHELLVCILDSIRETCRALSARASRLQLQENGDSNGIGRQPSLDGDGGKTLGNLRKSWKKRKEVKTNDKRNSPSEERAPSPDPEKDERSRPGWDFVADDFEGTMVVRTMCLECEAVTEKAQAVCELCVPVGDDDAPDEPFRAACLSSEYLRDQNKVIYLSLASDTMVARTMCLECEAVTEKAQAVCELCVPVGDDDAPDEPFRAACLSSEYLRDQNKYWCERCLRYNEARRSVAYSRLPRLLVLQLKRFSGGMEKITRHAPTPLLMPCFCEPCARRAADQPPAHRYILWAVIMHLGQTLTGGHYVAYARDSSQADTKCEREGGGDAATANSGSSFMRTLFNRPRPTPAGCTANECCVPRTRPEACWLACDDDLVKPISNEEFEDLLSAEPKMRSAATPYLLFYVKSEVG